MNNVSYGCKDGTLIVPRVGAVGADIRSNIHFEKGTEGVFADYEGGDFTIPENSKIFELISDFHVPDISQMGVLAK